MDNEILNCVEYISKFPSIYKSGNLSPIKIMQQCGYDKLFSLITPDLIVNYLIKNKSIIETWILFTEDIRHSPAWGFGKTENGKWIVVFSEKGSVIKKFLFENEFEACAKMIIITLEEIRQRNP